MVIIYMYFIGVKKEINIFSSETVGLNYKNS